MYTLCAINSSRCCQSEERFTFIDHILHSASELNHPDISLTLSRLGIVWGMRPFSAIKMLKSLWTTDPSPCNYRALKRWIQLFEVRFSEVAINDKCTCSRQGYNTGSIYIHRQQDYIVFFACFCIPSIACTESCCLNIARRSFAPQKVYWILMIEFIKSRLQCFTGWHNPSTSSHNSDWTFVFLQTCEDLISFKYRYWVQLWIN